MYNLLNIGNINLNYIKIEFFNHLDFGYYNKPNVVDRDNRIYAGFCDVCSNRTATIVDHRAPLIIQKRGPVPLLLYNI